jgi:hypothetical protein
MVLADEEPPTEKLIQPPANVVSRKKIPAPSPRRGELGRGVAREQLQHPSLTLPIEGRGPEESFRAMPRYSCIYFGAGGCSTTSPSVSLFLLEPYALDSVVGCVAYEEGAVGGDADSVGAFQWGVGRGAIKSFSIPGYIGDDCCNCARLSADVTTRVVF